eukprot:566956-Prymnesium_polylepis.1
MRNVCPRLWQGMRTRGRKFRRRQHFCPPSKSSRCSQTPSVTSLRRGSRSDDRESEACALQSMCGADGSTAEAAKAWLNFNALR